MRALRIATAVVSAAIAFYFQSDRVVLAQGCPTSLYGTCSNVGGSAGDSATAPTVVPLAIRQGPVNNPAADTPAGHVQHTPSLLDLGGGKLVTAFYDLGSNTPINRHL